MTEKEEEEEEEEEVEWSYLETLEVFHYSRGFHLQLGEFHGGGPVHLLGLEPH